ncbi:ATP-binding protein [Ureaplasma miroungigenitalium]|uniref:ATP-binding protein n=1 Tax=Ureaplasma miroungigenitalium TaxID=1042321 RepID=A0ABT3BN10_9BACT|nr:ATP-binding protein [Ureaplasma miroungigenitalium]MCV3728645.1 ATP-binding protein [Ureaplasma miroungigenitalium]MCV3734336.1 ATP-binding protein [Ureaplasma miroungigenitalium]
MISYIEFENKKTDELYRLDFDTHCNIILGCKGSGKSSLLLMIAEIIAEKAIDNPSLNDFKNRFLGDWAIKTICYDQTNRIDRINHKELKIAAKWEKIPTELQAFLPGYIIQNDDRKVSLDEITEIENTKTKVTKEFVDVIMNNRPFEKELKLFSELYDYVEAYYSLQDQTLDYTVFIKSNKSLAELKNKKTNFTHNLKYDPKPIIDRWDELQKQLQINYIDRLQLLLNSDKNVAKILHEINDLFPNAKQTHETLINMGEDHQRMIHLIEEQINKYKQIKAHIDQYKNTFALFAKVFRNKINENKARNTQEQNMFEKYTQVLDYFKKLPRILINIQNQYQKIINDDTIIPINWVLKKQLERCPGLEFRFKSFNLSNEEKRDIIKKYIGMPGNGNIRLDKLKLDKSNKTMQKIIEDLLKKTENEEKRIVLYANDKEYSTLSNGQKTMFGVLYGIEAARTSNDLHANYFLLDQIEDNLDSKTVFDEILPVLKSLKKENKQIFIVTHNPNLGILLDGKVIETDIHHPEMAFKFKNVETLAGHDNAQSIYLEGTMEALEQRRAILNQKIENKEGKN